MIAGKIATFAGGFSPRSISGLQLWLDGSDSGSVTLNGSNVSQWNDKSGGGRHATQGTSGSQPAYSSASLNNRATLSFDGTSDDVAGSLSYTLTSQTVIVVARLTAASGAGASYQRLYTQGMTSYTTAGSQDYDLSGHFIPLLRNVNQASIGSFADGGVRGSLTVTQNEWFIACSRHTGSQIQNSLNNGSAQTYSHTLNRSFQRYRVGNDLAQFQTGWWTGGVGEVVVYDRSISDTERNNLIRALGTKWGISVS